MKKEVLKSYFEKTCSGQEAAEVELWLLDPQNAAAFDRFLESYWDEHVHAQNDTGKAVVKQRSVLRRFLPRVAAAAAVLGVIVVAAAYFGSGENAVVQQQALAVVEPAPIASDTAELVMKADVVKESVVNTAEAHEAASAKKKTTRRPLNESSEMKAMVTTIGFADTATSTASAGKMVKPKAFTKIMINEHALSKMGETDRMAILHQMALRVDFNNASFKDIAAVFRDKYGIVLELCASNVPENVKKTAYTAQFSNVSFPDLMNDMSKQMMFSYTVVDNVVKVCFN